MNYKAFIEFVASIASIFAAIHFVRELLRDKRDAKLRAESGPIEIIADLSIERDERGTIRLIHISLLWFICF